jgi:hypothetical protein
MVGVNVKPQWADTAYGDPAKTRACIDRLGAQLVRVPWSTDTRTTDMLRWLANSGRTAIALVSKDRDPALQVEEMWASPYALAIEAVEGLNEPDLFVAGDWLAFAARHQAALYGAVAGRWPVLSPSAGHPQTGTRERDLHALPADILNCHRYAGNGPPSAALPVPAACWVTETGYSTYKTWYGSYVVSPDRQALWLPELVRKLEGEGAQRVVVHELLNLKNNWSSYMQPNDNWGLFTYGGGAKPVVAALGG